LATANEACASLKKKRITFHCLRHTTAMDLLHAGVEQSVIALWLGHESIETTQIYLDADLALKEKILARTIPFDSKPGKFRPDDRLLTFLNQL
jgi:site-specific recombinase XerD